MPGVEEGAVWRSPQCSVLDLYAMHTGPSRHWARAALARMVAVHCEGCRVAPGSPCVAFHTMTRWLSYDATNTSLAGIATVGLGGEDIAGFDLTAIQVWWEIRFDSSEPTECIGDINNDGVVDIGDINAFVQSFLSGCQ